MINHEKYAIKAGLFLIEWIKDNETIPYKVLAEKIDYPIKRGKEFPKEISKTLETLGKFIKGIHVQKEIVPFIQSLVINKSYCVPGQGYHSFIENCSNKSCRDKIKSILEEQDKALNYDYWQEVRKMLLEWKENLR